MRIHSHRSLFSRIGVARPAHVAPAALVPPATIAFAAALASPAAGQVLFEQLFFVENTQPHHVALGDVDGDGDLDVVVSNTLNDSVTIRLNERGVPRESSTFDVGDAPQGLALGDLDGDDDLDLVVVSSTSADVTMLHNDGRGSFTRTGTFVVGAGARQVTLGDLDGDGDLDLVAVARLEGTCTVLRNDGSGSFTLAAILTIGHEPSNVAIGDLDGDDRPDVVITRAGRITEEGWGDVVVLRNLGDGVLAAPIAYTTGTAPSDVAIGDIDGDGAPDLAVTNGGSREVAILPNRGGGDFGDGTASSNIYFDVAYYPHDAHLLDLDGDGDLDFATTQWTSVAVLLNTGGCAVCEDGSGSDCCIAHGGVGCDDEACRAKICEADPFCCDTEWDSLCAARAAFTNFDRRQHYDVDIVEFATPRLAAFGDLDGDGAPDLVVSAGLNDLDYLSVLVNDGGGRFAAERMYRVADEQGLGEGPLHATVADLDGNLAPDIVTANRGTDDVTVLMNPGDGELLPGVNYAAGSTPYAVAAGDVDGDGDADVLVANRTGASVSLLLNQGDGTLETPRELPTALLPVSVTLGDLDGDDDLDLVVGHEFGDSVSIHRNNGDGTFAPHESQVAGSVPWSTSIGDLDGDGLADLAVATRRDTAVAVLLSTNGDTFSPPVGYAVGGEPRSVVIGDWDGDGDLDVATASDETGTVSVLLNDGTGVFGASTDYVVYGHARHIAAGDVDGDRDPDLVVANGDRTYSVLLNAAGIFTVLDHRTATWETSSVALADFDGDDRLDVALTDAYPDRVYLAPNRYANATRCAADLDASGTVDVGDVLLVLFAWGPCATCPEDVDGSGIVDVADLGHLLLRWGPCP